MLVRLICYSETFVGTTMSLEEATMLSDSLEVAAAAMPKDVRSFIHSLQKELEAALVRARERKDKQDG